MLRGARSCWRRRSPACCCGACRRRRRSPCVPVRRGARALALAAAIACSARAAGRDCALGSCWRRHGRRQPRAGRPVGEVESPGLRMTLDHGTRRARRDGDGRAARRAPTCRACRLRDAAGGCYRAFEASGDDGQPGAAAGLARPRREGARRSRRGGVRGGPMRKPRPTGCSGCHRAPASTRCAWPIAG